MTRPEDVRAELGQLIDLHLAGAADALQCSRLNALLERSPDNRRFYQDYISQSVLLRQRKAAPGLELGPALALESSGLPAAAPRRAEEREPFSRLRRLSSAVLRDASWWEIVPVVAVASLITIFGVLIGFQLGREATPSPASVAERSTMAREADSPSPTTALAPSIVAPAPIATLVESINSRWHVGDLAIGSRLRTESLKLDQGIAVIQLDSGPRLRLIGPAELNLTSGQEVALAQGSVVARVPPEARGFAVVTPQGRVVDLGTEFGVRVDASRETQVHVFEGLVQLVSDTGAARPLTVGEACAISAGGEVTSIAAQPALFAGAAPAAPDGNSHELPPVVAPWTRLFGETFSAPLSPAIWQSLGAAPRLVDRELALPGESSVATTQIYGPPPGGLLHLRARLRFDSADGRLAIRLRAPTAEASGNDCLELLIDADRGNVSIDGELGTFTSRLPIKPGDTFDVDVVDDGRAVICSFVEVGGDGTRAGVARGVKTPATAGRVVFANLGPPGAADDQCRATLQLVSIETSPTRDLPNAKP